jgi:hypothetical protein
MRVNLDVLVDGQPVRLVSHEGRLYLPVPRLGVEYALRVTNHGPRRITAVLSVDGLSVLNSKPASVHQPGYIVDPTRSIVIQGWRRDRDTVKAFTFEPRHRSYAWQLGHRGNVGVIGLVAIEEWGRLPREFLEDRPGGFAGSLKARSAEVGGTGTGAGRDIDSPVILVPFVRSSHRRAITIYYDTPEALRRAGIPIDPPRPVPFPADRRGTEG